MGSEILIEDGEEAVLDGLGLQNSVALKLYRSVDASVVVFAFENWFQSKQQRIGYKFGEKKNQI